MPLPVHVSVVSGWAGPCRRVNVSDSLPGRGTNSRWPPATIHPDARGPISLSGLAVEVLPPQAHEIDRLLIGALRGQSPAIERRRGLGEVEALQFALEPERKEPRRGVFSLDVDLEHLGIGLQKGRCQIP